MLERSEQQIRAASGLEELLQITHFEDWKLWRCRLKLKSLTSTDSRSASHRSTRFAATFYDMETLKGRCMHAEAKSYSLSDSNKCANFHQKFEQGRHVAMRRKGGLWFHSFDLVENPHFLCLLSRETDSIWFWDQNSIPNNTSQYRNILNSELWGQNKPRKTVLNRKNNWIYLSLMMGSGSHYLGSNPSFSTYQHCDLEKAA